MRGDAAPLRVGAVGTGVAAGLRSARAAGGLRRRKWCGRASLGMLVAAIEAAAPEGVHGVARRPGTSASIGKEPAMTIPVDVDDLRSQVRSMYQQVAEAPEGEFHFEMGRSLAERLGYDPQRLDRIPAEAIASFAGVGHHAGLAALRPGDVVLDLGSGSGMDSFLAAHAVGPEGRVVGVDMTEAQLRKAERLRSELGLTNTSFVAGFAEALPVEDGEIDVVISNGVINLAPDKPGVFREIARVLRPGGRMAISDIVTDRQLTDDIVCNSSLWAACIGGAAQRDAYVAMIEDAGLRVETLVENDAYRFLSRSAQGATERFGVKSVSLLAHRVG